MADMRPDELAGELGVSGRTLRQWLRDTYPRPESEYHRGWHLTAAQEAAARKRFAVRWRRAATREGMVVTTIAFSPSMHRRLIRAADDARMALAEAVRVAVKEWLDRRGGKS